MQSNHEEKKAANYSVETILETMYEQFRQMGAGALVAMIEKKLPKGFSVASPTDKLKTLFNLFHTEINSMLRQSKEKNKKINESQLLELLEKWKIYFEQAYEKLLSDNINIEAIVQDFKDKEIGEILSEEAYSLDDSKVNKLTTHVVLEKILGMDELFSCYAYTKDKRSFAQQCLSLDVLFYAYKFLDKLKEPSCYREESEGLWKLRRATRLCLYPPYGIYLLALLEAEGIEGLFFECKKAPANLGILMSSIPQNVKNKEQAQKIICQIFSLSPMPICIGSDYFKKLHDKLNECLVLPTVLNDLILQYVYLKELESMLLEHQRMGLIKYSSTKNCFFIPRINLTVPKVDKPIKKCSVM